MKVSVSRLFLLGSVLVSTWLLSGCYYDPNASGYPPGGGYGGGGAYPPPQSNKAYNSGVSYGRQDARRGLARQASRHWNVVPPPSREAFANGYNVGYRNSGGGGSGGGSQAQQAYSQGQRYGASDARRGLARQASRHWSVVAPAFRESFAHGYNAGYLGR
ncbi:hypothetical protein ACFQY0_19720 [Haloferula chungangensis]|uniref:Lipoprotein n=1 Tax=Haloferula chungangensis TaxID=1048331 RepID=A0ABW2LD54_9BACT